MGISSALTGACFQLGPLPAVGVAGRRRWRRRFQPPTVEDSFFFDRIGDGTFIASVKAMVLLVLGTVPSSRS